MDNYRLSFFQNYLCNFYEFEGREHNSLIASSGERGASLIQIFQIRNPLDIDLKQNTARIFKRDVLKQ